MPCFSLLSLTAGFRHCHSVPNERRWIFSRAEALRARRTSLAPTGWSRSGGVSRRVVGVEVCAGWGGRARHLVLGCLPVGFFGFCGMCGPLGGPSVLACSMYHTQGEVSYLSRSSSSTSTPAETAIRTQTPYRPFTPRQRRIASTLKHTRRASLFATWELAQGSLDRH